ncbi:MAG: LacI family DNA-binding transcriptional regulator [Lentisphaeria bacterium]|nr:LacI family DNA-binding transcriptional regulator [Lentisphaeria bacterium]
MTELKGKRRSSLQDVAFAAGVDVSTVSLVLNGKPLAERMRPETRQRIRDCAERLNYRPSRAARMLKTGKTGMIGMVVGDIASLYYSELVAMALAAAEKYGKQLLISATEWAVEKEHAALKRLLDVGVDGIIYLPASLEQHRDLIGIIRREEIPLVTYDCKVPGFSAIHCDYTRGMELAVGELAKRHARIGYISFPNEVSNKLESILAAGKKHGVAIERYSFTGADSFGRIEFESSAITAGDAPEAWIIGGGEKAIFLLTRLLHDGFRIPEDRELIGIAVPRISALGTPSLAHIELDTQGLMDAAFELLSESGAEREIHVPTRFNKCESIKP